MAVTVISYPPLGQVTSLSTEKIQFTALLESTSTQKWEVQIWHNIGVSEWTALPLEKSPSTTVPHLSGGQDGTRLVYTGEIIRPDSGTARFTVRYRGRPDDDWQWANNAQHLGDGELIFVSSDIVEVGSSAEDFARYFDNLSPDVTVGSRKSESPGAALWHLSGSVDPASEGQSGVLSLPLGTASSVSRFFALVRVSTPWLGPRQGKSQLALNEDAILVSFLRTDGVHVVLLGVSGIDDVQTVLGSGSDGEVVVKSRNDNTASARFQVLAAAAPGFEIAMSALIYEARKLVRPYNVSPGGVEAQWLSSWYDGLTFCTWNAIGQSVTEEKLMSALNDLKSNGIKIKGLIIDDGWQSLDNEGAGGWHRGMTRFEANDSFPNGLARAVSTIREQHPNIEYIAVWHALLGYWGGISPTGELAAAYKTKEVQINSTIRSSILAIDPSDIQRFYNDFYTFLSSAGITGVKADAQSFLDLLVDPIDRKTFTTAYQDAWSISSLRHFGPRVISCMSQYPQPIFHSQLPTTKPTIVVRNSDDFFPDIQDSHAWHIFCNAHNALLTRYLNVLPDWDMFQTSHPYASFHAAARCISGGPIYITDTPGQHNQALINQITAPTIQNTTIILRPSLVGRTLDMYNAINESPILRIGTYTGRAKTGSGILALFNVSAAKSSTLTPLSAFPGIYASDTESSYIVRAHSTGHIADALTESSILSTSLDVRGWEILTAYPVHSINFKNDLPTQVSILGLLGKMTGVAALLSSDVYVESNGRLRVDVALKALGVLGIYFSDFGRWDVDGDFMVMVSGRAVPRGAVWREGGKVLAVDLEGAWGEMGLQAGWGNEVRVSVFLN
ncbi:raffinose synthase or seed imbibition protein Sip1-domain-containing protein [Aspergillus karnatakaensis]|uniref:putative raffinose synthase protein Sip1 n=1 Tax=Aspergillus karnatakaensis TaxID=1810916 RepID=UPI003CCD3005